MATKNLNIRVEESLKAKADQLCGELGIPLATAVNIFLKSMVRYNGFPFEVRVDIPQSATPAVDTLLKFAANHRVIENAYQFNREDGYDR
jgi:addiction module RelB/DinJ family antitoxin